MLEPDLLIEFLLIHSVYINEAQISCIQSCGGANFYPQLSTNLASNLQRSSRVETQQASSVHKSGSIQQDPCLLVAMTFINVYGNCYHLFKKKKSNVCFTMSSLCVFEGLKCLCKATAEWN